MKKIFIISLTVAVTVISIYAFVTYGFGLEVSQEDAHGHEHMVASDYIAIKGDVICLGCTLKKEEGAKAQCSTYGHKNAIRSADGRIWSILENDASSELVNNHDFAGRRVLIRGRKYPKAQIIEVEEYKFIE